MQVVVENKPLNGCLSLYCRFLNLTLTKFHLLVVKIYIYYNICLHPVYCSGLLTVRQTMTSKLKHTSITWSVCIGSVTHVIWSYVENWRGKMRWYVLRCTELDFSGHNRQSMPMSHDYRQLISQYAAFLVCFLCGECTTTVVSMWLYTCLNLTVNALITC